MKIKIRGEWNYDKLIDVAISFDYDMTVYTDDEEYVDIIMSESGKKTSISFIRFMYNRWIKWTYCWRIVKMKMKMKHLKLFEKITIKTDLKVNICKKCIV